MVAGLTARFGSMVWFLLPGVGAGRTVAELRCHTLPSRDFWQDRGIVVSDSTNSRSSEDSKSADRNTPLLDSASTTTRLSLCAAAAFLPGLLAGTQICGLLFFLNPGLPFSAKPIIRGILHYGGLLGLLTLLMLLPLTWKNTSRAARLLPWSISAALGVSALLDWAQASHFGFFLDPGINIRLIKAALSLSLASLIFFYTALSHAASRRRYGLRSRVGLILLALASVYVMLERREAFQPTPPPSPRPSVVENDQRPELWLVGLDGATLDVIWPLAEQGQLPFFSILLEQGSYGRMRSLSPSRRVSLWTTVATGRYPYRHGVLAPVIYPAHQLARGERFRLVPEGVGFEYWGLDDRNPLPVTRTDRKALMLWEILDRLGISTGVIGWPTTFPVSSQALGYAFSERFFGDAQPPGTAYPQELAERGALFSVEANEIDSSLENGRFVDLAPGLGDRVARDLWRERLLSFVIEQRRDVVAHFLLLPGLGEISRRHIGAFAAVQFDGNQAPQMQRSAAALVAYYQHLDEYLGSLWDRRRGSPLVLAVVSAYGMDAPSAWQNTWARLSGRDTAWGSHAGEPDGTLFLLGSGIRPANQLDDLEIVDVMPTLLYGMGLPLARDLDGRVQTDAFEPGHLARHPVTFVPSYETLNLFAGPE